jgi:hypothetical protein
MNPDRAEESDSPPFSWVGKVGKKCFDAHGAAADRDAWIVVCGQIVGRAFGLMRFGRRGAQSMPGSALVSSDYGPWAFSPRAG